MLLLAGPACQDRRVPPPARAAAVLVPAGAAVMLLALIAAPGPWLSGYVSEIAASASAYAAAYRIGLLALAAGVGLLGVSLRPTLIATALFVAAALAGVSATVSCTPGCPLPPYEPTTPADLVHGAASVLGLVVLAGAMALTALSPARRPALRRLSAVGTLLIVPLGAALGLTMLIAGRDGLGAILERVVLVVAVSWLTGAALLTGPAAVAARQPVVGRSET